MIKMQILFDEDRVRREGRYQERDLQSMLDSLMVGELHFAKEPDGFYCGTGTKNDYAHFGIAYSVLRDRPWFMDNISSWLYFNSGSCDNPHDFIIEDFKAHCEDTMQESVSTCRGH